MRIQLDSNLNSVARKYKRFGRQFNFAAAKTMNRLVKDGGAMEGEQMKRDIDRPTPFTYGRGRGTFMRTEKNATARSLTNIQTMKDRQAAYLFWQIYGGVQSAISAPGDKSGRRILVPTRDQPRNQYGNVARPSYRKVVETVKNNPDQWRVSNGGIFKKFKSAGRSDGQRFVFSQTVNYKPIYSFGLGYLRHVKDGRLFKRIYEQEIRKALATAR